MVLRTLHLAALLAPFAIIAAAFEADIDALRDEISLVNSTLLLADYTEVLDPDPCWRNLLDLTTPEMQALLNSHWVRSRGQAEQFFIDLITQAQVLSLVSTISNPRSVARRFAVWMCAVRKLTA